MIYFCYIDIQQTSRRPLGFRAGVHKSESAKEMLLSQHMFGALPPSPPSSSADVRLRTFQISSVFGCLKLSSFFFFEQ